MLRILGRTSSINVRKTLWTAGEAGLAVTHEAEWAGARDTRSAEFLALNPNGLVPVLVSDEGILWESNTICRYLAARSGRDDLLPRDPFPRAQVETWMDWQATELNTAWRAAFLGLVRRSPEFVDDWTAIERSSEQWNARMRLLEQHMADGRAYVVGERFSLADIVLGLSLQRWLLTPMSRPATPALLAWRERLQARPAAQAWIDLRTP